MDNTSLPKSGSSRLAWAVAAGAVIVAIGMAWRLSAFETKQTQNPKTAIATELLPRLSSEAQAASPPPENALDLTTEQRRMKRYDKDADGFVSREEYLASRRKAYGKLDKDGDGKLSFDEYATKTIDKFNTADASGDTKLSVTEFATTAAKRKAAALVECPPEGNNASDRDG
jgi:EF hand